MKRKPWIDVCVFVTLVAIAVTVRLVSERPNFNAVTAATLFAGFYFRSRLTAFCVPLVVMPISDYFLGGYSRPMMAAIYLSMLVPIAWRGVLRRSLSPLTVGGGAISSSVSFFILSNAAVWYAWYPLDWQGLARCYGVALPFFANALASDVIFSATFFGVYALAVQLRPERAAAPEAVADR